MDLATLNAIFSVLSEIASFLIKYGPGLIQNVENIVSNLKLAYISATSGTPITVDQQKQIDDALETARTALDAAATKAEADDAADAGNTGAA